MNQQLQELLKKEPMKRTHHESKLQQGCIFWFRSQYPKLRKLLFAVPNGGKRWKTESKILLAEGVVPGVSDLILLVPRKEHGALCIEMKYGKNDLSNHQQDFKRDAEKYGNKYIVCRTVDEFIREVTFYLSQ